MRSEDLIAAEGLAAIAVTLFEMGEPASRVESSLLAHWASLGRPDFRTVVVAARSMPLPAEESVEKSARLSAIREALGATSVEAQLNAALAARELLEKLAARFA